MRKKTQRRRAAAHDGRDDILKALRHWIVNVMHGSNVMRESFAGPSIIGAI
jgi:hypothetical protein